MNFDELWATPGDETWPQAVEAYIASGGDVNAAHPESGWTLLHLAAEYTLPDAIRLLVRKGADVNLQDKQGYTAAHWAVGSDIDGAIQCQMPVTFATTRVFAEAGADFTIRDNRGESARDLAAAYGGQMLVLYEAAINLTDPPTGIAAPAWKPSLGNLILDFVERTIVRLWRR